MRAPFLLMILTAAFVLLAGCGSGCVDTPLQAARHSPDGRYTAIIVDRACGTARGFIVKVFPSDLGQDNAEVIFMAMTGPDNPPIATAADVTWIGPTALDVSYPSWIISRMTPPEEQEFHYGITVTAHVSK